MSGIHGLNGKIILRGKIIIKSGLHIGGSNQFSAIGAVDSPVVRDTLTKRPFIPGSSLKGKMRYLLARVYAGEGFLVQFSEEDPEIRRLFGSSEKEGRYVSRLQFSDSLLTDQSTEMLERFETGLYLSEVKFENTINRLTGEANPRQLERVPAGAEFDLKIVYNIEVPDEAEQDLKNLRLMMNLLEEDYLGGHGTRGYGRIEFAELAWETNYYREIPEGFDSMLKDLFGTPLGEV